MFLVVRVTGTGSAVISGWEVSEGWITVPAGMAVVAVALWWWEVRSLGQLPAGSETLDLAPICLRYLAHLLLFAFLAAAAWVDLVDRVIPDSITVPGVLCVVGMFYAVRQLERRLAVAS